MQLHAQILGEGPPLLILHGFLGMGDNWKTLGNKFAQDGYQVHLIDQRNHGRSFHDDLFSYEVMSKDLKNYCDFHQLEKVSVIGHSMGGKTAMLFAVDYPDVIAKLIVADIAPKSYPQHHQDILKSLSLLNFDTIKKRSEADAILSKYIQEKSTRQFLLKNLYWIEKGKLALRVNLPVVTKNIAEVGKALKKNALFKKDVLFLRGDKSGYIETMDELLIQKHFPAAKIETINNAGHWLHAENPTQFHQFVINFL